MPADIAQTLSGLSEVIEQRATALTSQAIQEGHPWVRRLGSTPTDLTRRAARRQQLRTVVAYRDRYDISGSDPLSPSPSGQGQRLDHQRAELAARQAQTTCIDDVPRRHGPEQRIDGERSFGL